MNRIQQADTDRISGKIKPLFEVKRQSSAQPTMRHGFILFALLALTAYGSKATATSFPFERLAGDLKTSHPGMQVWAEKGAHKVNVDSNGVILKGYDVVAYFTQKKAIKGSSKYQSNYEGAIYYFGSAADLATFKKNPSKYVPQYGGFCANGVKNNKLNDSDPTVFFIVKGKLYVCASPEAEKEFRAHEDEDIVTANRNWEQLIH
jgi:YHS domain-containing protein